MVSEDPAADSVTAPSEPQLPLVPGRLLAALPALAAFVVALALQVRTLLPDVAFWDTAEFQAIGPVLGIAHPTGYPSYTLLAWLGSVVLQPFGGEAFRANLLSALLVSGACALTAIAVMGLTRRPLIALAAGLCLAFTPTVWRIALRADAHALHLFLIALLLVLLLAWGERSRGGSPTAGRWLVVAAVVFGVALGNHALTLLLAPGVALFIVFVDPWLPVRHWRLMVVCAAALVLTTVALYAYIPLRSAMDPPLDYADPESWEAVRYLVLGEQFRGTFSALPSLSEGMSLVWQQLSSNLGVLAPVALAGVILTALRWPRLAALSIAWFVLTFVFALGYVNAEIERYYLVPLMLAVLWAALGVATALEWVTRGAAVAVGARAAPAPAPDVRGARSPVLSARAGPPGLVSTAFGGLAAALLLAPVAIGVPAHFDDIDASGDRQGRAWLDATFAALEPDAVVVSWWSFSTTMWYGRFVEHRRPDITIIDDRTILDEDLGDVLSVIERYRAERPVYVIRLSRDLPEIEDVYTLELVPGIPSIGEVRRVVPSGLSAGR